MIGPILSRIAEAYYAPRRSARRILDARLSGGQILVLWLLGELVHRLILLVMTFESHFQEVMIGGDLLPDLFTDLSLDFILFLITGLAFLLIGRLFGGKGDARSIFTIAAWLSFVTVWLGAPLFAVSILLFKENPIGFSLILLSFLCLCMWILSSFLVEAHGFRRVGVVFAATFGITIFLGFLFTIVFSLFFLSG